MFVSVLRVCVFRVCERRGRLLCGCVPPERSLVLHLVDLVGALWLIPDDTAGGLGGALCIWISDSKGGALWKKKISQLPRDLTVVPAKTTGNVFFLVLPAPPPSLLSSQHYCGSSVNHLSNMNHLYIFAHIDPSGSKRHWYFQCVCVSKSVHVCFLSN